MDNLLAIGLGLGLRALIDTVTNHNHRVDGSLVGLWEGAVLRHFISKYPSSLDPYIAYGFRLLVDLLWTSNWMRLIVVVLWTFMGMLLSDVGVDLTADRRFRRLTREIRHTFIYPLLRQFSRRRTSSSTTPSRVQIYQIPASNSPTSTARSPPLQSRTPTDAYAPIRSSAATPMPRRPALRVPGSFSASETDTEAGRMSREPSIASPQEGSVTSRTSSSRTPSVTFSDPLVSNTRPAAYDASRPTRTVPPIRSATPSISSVLSPPSSASSIPHMIPPPITRLPPSAAPPATSATTVPPRPRSPELEYVTIPAIPDNIEQTNPIRPVLSDDERSVGSNLRGHSDRSGLTTPTSDRARPRIDVYSPEPVQSGLTTPANRPSTPQDQYPAASVATGSDATPIPIPIRVYERTAEPDDAEQVKASLLHPELLPDINTPQPSPGLVPPAQYLPSPVDEKQPIRMPEPQLASDTGVTGMSTTEPPPAYEQTPGEAEDRDHTPAESVISYAGDRQRLLQRAESLRSIADETEKRRSRLRREHDDAKRNKDHWGAFRLKHEMERAEKETRELHAKAARRFYQAHNLRPEPQTIDVHRLKVSEALPKVEEALYDAIVTNTPELRIITGRGNHSKNGIPALKNAINGAMSDYHIDAFPDPTNPGVLVIKPPHNPSFVAGPSKPS